MLDGSRAPKLTGRNRYMKVCETDCDAQRLCTCCCVLCQSPSCFTAADVTHLVLSQDSTPLYLHPHSYSHHLTLLLTLYSPQGKLAGTGGADSGGPDPAAMAAVRFCLSLFSASLKRNKMDPTDRVVLSMAAPFVPLLGQCLRLSGAVDVVTLATRCLCTLLTWGIRVEASFVQAVGM